MNLLAKDIRAIPRTGQRGAAPMLAGSQTVWFDQVQDQTQPVNTEMSVAKDLPPEVQNHLSDLRPQICGLSMDRPRIMGILNVTPDSFSDGGQLSNLQDAVDRARVLAQDADILDIGGESTRPGAETVGVKAEIARIAPVIRAIRAAGMAIPISIDTRKSEVARAALEAGANMVNDVSALTYDSKLAPLVAEANVPICLMHAAGDPKTMQDAPQYENVLTEVYDFLERRISAALASGIRAENIVVDPGIGFGKTTAHNLLILKNLSYFHGLGVPVLLGASRKRLIDEISGAKNVSNRLAGSLAIAMHAAGQATQILRVHDTYETRQALNLYLAMNEGKD